ncbi:MAG: autotransporter-associated beta strand repeat-containing protein [Planctomycetota bacterium]
MNLVPRPSKTGIAVALASIATLSTVPALAQTTNWTQATLGDMWQNPGNWSAGVPTADTTAEFDNDANPIINRVTVSADAFASRLVFLDDVAGITNDLNVSFQDTSGGIATLNTQLLEFRPGVAGFGVVEMQVNFFDMNVVSDDGFQFGPNNTATVLGDTFVFVNRSTIRSNDDNSTAINGFNATFELVNGSHVVNDGTRAIAFRGDGELVVSGGSDFGWNFNTTANNQVFIGSGGGRLSKSANLDGSVNMASGGPLTFGRNGDTTFRSAVLNGVVAGPSGITIDGDNYDVQLNASNTFTGDILLAGGRLLVNGGPNLGALGKDIVFNGGTYAPGGSFATAIETRFDGDGTIDTSRTGGLHALAAATKGTGTLTKTGAGELRLDRSGANFTGNYVIDEGMLRVNQSNAVNERNSVTIHADGRFQISQTATVKDVRGSGILAVEVGTILRMGQLSPAGPTPDGSIFGTGTILKQGGSFQRFSGDNSGFAGNWDVDARRLTLAGPDAAFADAAVAAGATLRLEQFADTTVSYDGRISGTGTVEVIGRYNITGNSGGYTGDTFVDGFLGVDGLLGGNVFVGNDSILGGDGTLGDVTLNGTGRIAPGTDPLLPAGSVIGSLETFSLTMGDDSSMEMQILGSAGGEGDLITANVVQLDGDLVVRLDAAPVFTFEPSVGDSFLIVASSNITGSFDNVAFGERIEVTGSGVGSFTVLNIDGGILLADYQIPEPSVLGLLGAGVLLMRRR